MNFQKPIIFIAAVMLITACATVPITGRRQLNIVPSKTMLEMSFQQYDQFLTESELSQNRRDNAMVQRVGLKLQTAVEMFFTQNGMEAELQFYDWEFNLVESEEINAWCMPGGKVVIYTGILPITESEAGLAVVMAHEIAHAVAEHGNERMSQALLADMGGMALTKALETRPVETKDMWMNAFGVTTQLGVLLPYSRLHESEADHLGLVFMAMAGYDPHAAVPFWRRMADIGTNTKPPEFFSTHPADETRIKDIEDAIPDAMHYYDDAVSNG